MYYNSHVLTQGFVIHEEHVCDKLTRLSQTIETKYEISFANCVIFSRQPGNKQARTAPVAVAVLVITTYNVIEVSGHDGSAERCSCMFCIPFSPRRNKTVNGYRE